MFNKCGESGHHCLISIFRGKAFSFHQSILAVGFPIWPLPCWGTVPIRITLLFFINGWILSNGFSPSIEIMFFIVSVMLSHSLADTEPFLHPWSKPVDHGVMILSLHFHSVFKYFVEGFCIYVHPEYWPVIFFVCVCAVPLSDFVIRVILFL